MALRRLTVDQIEQLAASIAHKQQFEAAQKYAADFYGPEAYRVKIVVSSEYNDENYDNEIQRIKVYDNKGRRLFPSLDLPKVASYLRRASRLKLSPSDEQREEVEDELWSNSAWDNYDFGLDGETNDEHGDEELEFTLTGFPTEITKMALYIDEPDSEGDL